MNKFMRSVIFLLIVAIVHSTSVHALDIEWTYPPETISTSGINASSPTISIDPSGNAIILWIENGVVLSKEGTEYGGWSTSTVVSGSGSSNPLIGIDSLGNVIAVWIENGVVNSRNKPAGQKWSGTVSQLSNVGASTPQLAVNSSGEAVAVWVLNNTIESATGSFSGGWNPAVAVSASNSSIPQVAIDDSGYIVAVWEQLVSSVSSIYSSTLSAGGSWSTPVMISTSGENCTSPNIAANTMAFEKAIAIWYSYDLIGSNYSNVYTQVASLQQNETWALPLKLFSPGKMDPHPFPTKIVLGDMGDAVAMWITSTDGSLYTAGCASKPKGGYWSFTNMVLVPNQGTFGFALCPEKFGAALGAWMLLDPDSNNLIVQTSVASVVLMHLDPGGVNEGSTDEEYISNQMMWTPFATLSQGTSNGYPQLAVNFLNNYVQMAACWLSFDGSNTSIQASIGGMDEPISPTGLSVSQATKNYGLINDTYNTLTWIASASSDVYLYKIYRNGIYIQTVPSTQLQWIDHNQVINQSVTYGVQTVALSQLVSEIAEITWP